MTPPIPRTHSGEPSRLTLHAIFVSGLALSIGSLLFFLYLASRWPVPYSRVWELVPVHFVSGRAGNAGVGLELGFPRSFILFQCCVLDFIIMLLVYPIFVAGFRRAEKWPVIGSTLTTTHEMALRHKDRLERYGALGLILFVMFPLWSTGPLVGVVLGYLLGMRTWLTFAAVMTGNAAMTAAWIWLFHFLKVYNETIARFLLAVILIGAVGGMMYRAYAKWRRKRYLKAVEALASRLDEKEVGHLAAPKILIEQAGGEETIGRVGGAVGRPATTGTPSPCPSPSGRGEEAVGGAVPPSSRSRGLRRASWRSATTGTPSPYPSSLGKGEEGAATRKWRPLMLLKRSVAALPMRRPSGQEGGPRGFHFRRPRKTLRGLLERQREAGGRGRFRGLRGRLSRGK
ncbi:MAG TPA: small multi-drug export protein [Candidatus Hydrogenedentes bacterium]|nr:small multi-drug export protein [Candidatus Hydrogenedentota bacterium]